MPVLPNQYQDENQTDGNDWNALIQGDPVEIPQPWNEVSPIVEPPPVTSGPEVVPGNEGGGFGGGDFGYADLLGKMNFGSVPQFKAPRFAYNQRFAAPTAESVLADPGYKFRLGQGEQALQQSAAGRGVLRTGGTLKNILEYGQNFASQEYGNVFDRELQKFMTNYGVERDIFDRYYTGSKDEYAPNLLDWQTRAAAQQRAAELEFLKQQALELEALRGGAE